MRSVAVLTALQDLVLPRVCSGCGALGGHLCEACRALLRGAPLGPVRPRPCPAGLPLVHAFGPYDGPLKRLLLAHKERGRLALSAPLGQALGRVVAGLAEGDLGSGRRTPVVLCPVPSSRAAVRSRGYDHAGRLAGAAATELRRAGAHVQVRPLLGMARAVEDQAGLTSGQRAANLRGALRALPGQPGGGAVVVVDDVVTTGATLVEAARALSEAGHRVVGAAVLGATQRRSSPLRG